HLAPDPPGPSACLRPISVWRGHFATLVATRQKPAPCGRGKPPAIRPIFVAAARLRTKPVRRWPGPAPCRTGRHCLALGQIPVTPCDPPQGPRHTISIPDTNHEKDRLSFLRALVALAPFRHPQRLGRPAAIHRPCGGRRGTGGRRRLFPRPPFRAPAGLALPAAG